MKLQSTILWAVLISCLYTLPLKSSPVFKLDPLAGRKIALISHHYDSYKTTTMPPNTLKKLFNKSVYTSVLYTPLGHPDRNALLRALRDKTTEQAYIESLFHKNNPLVSSKLRAHVQSFFVYPHPFNKLDREIKNIFLGSYGAHSKLNLIADPAEYLRNEYDIFPGKVSLAVYKSEEKSECQRLVFREDRDHFDDNPYQWVTKQINKSLERDAL